VRQPVGSTGATAELRAECGSRRLTTAGRKPVEDAGMAVSRSDGTPFLNGQDFPDPEMDVEPGMAAELELEAARWAQIMALVALLTPEERLAPGYFRDPDWTVKDLLAHLGWWHGEARSELLKIATRMYEDHDFDIDRRNAEVLAAHKDDAWDVVLSGATAARAWMLEAWVGLRDRPPTADRWVRKAGAEHYGEHLDRLRAWTAQLIDFRTRPAVDERDP
jgi:hypothetical protein